MAFFGVAFFGVAFFGLAFFVTFLAAFLGALVFLVAMGQRRVSGAFT